MPPPFPREPRLSHDRRILLMAFASAAPGAVISLVFLWTGDFTPKVQWTLSVLIVTVCLGFAFALRERVVLPLQTLSNLLAALGEGDFSIRARGARGGAGLGGLCAPRRRRPRRRPAGRGDDRAQRAGRDAQAPAARRARSHDLAAQ